MRDRRVQRVVVLGTGTEVGKSHVTAALARSLREGGDPTVALKPVETGAPFEDARRFDVENPFRVQPHPRIALDAPISPHLAAREAGVRIELEVITTWCDAQELALCDNMLPHARAWSLIETAGGALSPLAPGLRNFELMRALAPDQVILVARDALGVLSAVDTTLVALRALGREPDWVVLSASGAADASTGRNAEELASLGIATPAQVFAAGQREAAELAARLRARAGAP